VQILTGIDADTFDIAMDKFWGKRQIKPPIQAVKHYKRHPGTYPRATGPETGGMKYLADSLGWEKKEAFESSVTIRTAH
jgi:hypothetical protein